MWKRDNISALFWLILSLFILKEGRFLFFGTPSHPGPGFFPFILGIILGILSLIILGKSWLGEKNKGESLRFFSERKGWGRISLTLGGMLVFYLILESVGFLLASFFLVLLMIKFIGQYKWIYTVWISALISFCSYMLFKVLLQVNLPQGFTKGLGF